MRQAKRGAWKATGCTNHGLAMCTYNPHPVLLYRAHDGNELCIMAVITSLSMATNVLNCAELFSSRSITAHTLA